MSYIDSPMYKMYKALGKGKLEEVKAFMNQGCDIHHVTESDQWTYLHKMADRDNTPVETIQFLIDQELDVNAIDSYGNTPLIYAVRQKNVAGMRLLLANGADRLIGHWNADGVDALKMALKGKPMVFDMVKLLLDFGADPDAKREGVRSVREVLQIIVGVEPEARELIEQYAKQNHL